VAATASLPPRPAPAAVAPRRRPQLRGFAAPLVFAAVVGLWLALAPRTPDLAAQAYRVWLERRFGFSLFDGGWYDGHLLPGYSLLFPPLAAAIGMRTAGALAATVSLATFTWTVRRLWRRPQPLAETAFALAVAGDLWIGRLTFALGVSFAVVGIGAALLCRGGKAAWLAGLASATASPVAGLLLAAFACAYPLARVAAGGWAARASRPDLKRWLALAAGGLVGAFAIQMLFPEGGHEPYGATSLAAALAVCLALFLGAPADWPELRFCALAYALLNLLSEVHTPMGSNVERLGILAFPPLLGLALANRRPTAGGPLSFRLPRRLGAAAGWCALGAALSWVLYGPITQTASVAGNPGLQAAFYRPLERYLAAHHPRPLRIEVPFTLSHWEAALLARQVPLARGWERQLDKLYNHVLEVGLTAASYRHWLDENGVAYVALPVVPLDPSSALERRVIASRPPYLKLVALLPGWRVFKVFAPRPLAFALGGRRRRAELIQLGHTAVTVRVSGPGSYLLRVRFNPYLTVAGGTVREGRDGFTVLHVRRAGRYTVVPTFSLAGATHALVEFFERFP